MLFAFVREARSPFHGSYFSFMTECAKWKTNDVGYPNFSAATIQFSSDIRTDDGFWSEVLQMVWSGSLVNAQFYGPPWRQSFSVLVPLFKVEFGEGVKKTMQGLHLHD
ncbi:hypothetical protein AVEN_55783-1 [Araneus ventricosus]|uniref:Uncharacterized protein n=1 Tax=Araneus ventricosus TaxID=182803 RepID=A0A4Y2EZ03_ARAVE|nr:hypothetical protein AVEN_55783-1 [Araneus ventricosus]